MLDQVTPLILTWNEEPNIARVLGRLGWAREVVVVDSGSHDGTRTLLAQFDNVRSFERKFDSHAAQWNYGLTETGIGTEWVLALDADYVLPDEFVAELARLQPEPGTTGYRAQFTYYSLGRPLSGSLYPGAVVLYRRSAGRYVQDGHTQRLRIAGNVLELRARIMHDDRKPLSRWLDAQLRYARLEAEMLGATHWRDLRWTDRLRKLLVVMPPLVFVYCLVVRRGALDGRAGVYYALQRAIAEAVLSLALIERRIGDR